MPISKYFYVSQMLLISIFLSACGSSSSDSNPATSDVGIRFSDAPVEDLASVVITVDKLTFRHSNGDNIVVDTFTSEELGLVDSETFQLNLLELQGLTSSLVLDSVALPVGDYQNLIIEVLDDSENNDTYVQEIGSEEHKNLKVPSKTLKLGGFTVSATSSQTFVVEFGLRHAMTYNPGPDRYILKPRGVRIVRLADASNISGNVELTSSCDPSDDTSLSHVAYLYEGHELNAELLGDVFVRESDLDVAEQSFAGTDFDENVPENIIAPVVATSVDGETGEYLFSYLNDGDYTIAISCNAPEDNSVIYDEITIPSPAPHLVELTLATETNMACDFVEGFDATCEENTSPLE